MRVCPKCGYSELIWLHCGRGFRFTDYAHISQLTEELAMKLMASPKFYSDGLFNYELTKSGFVHRIWKEDAINPNSMKEPDMEKPKNRIELATIYRKVFPPKQEFVTSLREQLKGKEPELEEFFGERWKHWIRRDNSGFCYPTWEDWLILRDKFGVKIEAHLVISNQKRLLENCKAKKEKWRQNEM